MGATTRNIRNPLTRPAIRLRVLSVLLDLGGIAVKRFVALFLLLSGLLVAGGANAANLGNITTTGCLNGYSQTTISGSVGDTFTVTNNSGGLCSPFSSSNTNVLTLSSSSLSNGQSTTVNLVGVGTATFDFGGLSFLAPHITVTVTAPAAIPTLSEWTLMLLGLMVMATLGWYWNRERSY